MSERVWSPAQRSALDVRNRDTLVSAAAGSGKTSVLCQRILDRLQDKNAPLELSRLLVVTFTNAAAAELRARLQSGIAKAMAENPSAHLRRQSMALHRANICTIDKYCINFVKNHFHLLGISPDVSVAEDSALSDIKHRTMLKIIDRFYENELDFIPTSDIFITDRDENDFPDKLIDMYEGLLAYAKGVDAIDDVANELEDCAKEGVFGGKWGQILKEHLTGQLEFYRLLCLATLEQYSACTDKKGNPVGGELQGDLAIAASLATPLSCGDTKGLQKALENRPAFGRKTLPKDSFADHFTDARTKFKKLLGDPNGFSLPFTDGDMAALYTSLAHHCRVLHKVLSAYEEMLMQEKKRLNLLEFSDMERMTLSLLEDKDGNPTSLALEMKEQFDEVFIDEYQDVNDIQNRIFIALSRGKRFLVGDVKQSIYGFRYADPTIFSGLRASFADEKEKDAETCRIFLQNNYRCDKNVVHFTNAVCDVIFPHCRKLGYLPEDALVYAKAEGEQNIPVEVHLVKKAEDFFPNVDNVEASFLAERIQTLIQSGRKAGDIAVLCRSLQSEAVAELQKELQKRQIAVSVSGLSTFFEESEILLTLSLVRAVDNPTKDIPLAAIARCPLFGFSDKELVQIGRYKAETLSQKMSLAAENGDQKAKKLLEQLECYRRLCLEEGISALLFALYEDPLFHMAIQSETAVFKEQEERLQYLYGIALGSQDISSFLSRIERMEQEGLRERKDRGASADQVRIMTIHGSKGLEFPVCCLFATQRYLSTHAPDASDFDPHLGPAFSLKDPSGLATIQSVQQIARGLEAKNKDLDEEMRILYVALTRAKEHLIITGSPKTAKTETFVEKCRFYASACHRNALSELPSYLAWIVMAICQTASPETYGLYENGVLTKGTPMPKITPEDSPKPEEITSPVEEILSKEVLIARRDFVYPHKVAEMIPAKLSVSTLRDDLLFDEGSAMLRSDSAITLATPRFLNPQKTDTSPAKRGVATHAVMQFCDFTHAQANGAKAEILRQRQLGFLSENEAALADAAAIDRFFQSELFSEMQKAKLIRREQRFMITLPATRFTDAVGAEGEELLVQGVIDCYFYDSRERIWLVDYKTDRFDPKTDPETVKNELISRHGTQMQYYKEALKQLLGKEVYQTVIYSFHLNCGVLVPSEDRKDKT